MTVATGIAAGTTWFDTGRGAAGRVRLRHLSYGPLTARNQPLRSWLLILHRKGDTRMSRRIESKQERSHVFPNKITLHPSQTPAFWSWADPIEVLHVHLATELLNRAAHEVLGVPLNAVHLRHGLGFDDAHLRDLVLQLEREAIARRPGAQLCMDGLSAQITVSLMRAYGQVKANLALTPAQCGRISDLVCANLATAISVEQLARAAGLGRTVFANRFAASFGTTPHQFVLRMRLERAKELLDERTLSIAEIAATTGFTDQSHLTRHFSGYYGATPAQYRSGH